MTQALSVSGIESALIAFKYLINMVSVNIEDRLGNVLEEIRSAAESAGRDPGEIRLVAVSKTHAADKVREAIAAGVKVLGENKVQEGLSKIGEIGDQAEWHLIGHLQKNKVRKAVRAFDVIETVDSVALAKRIDRIAGEEGIKELRTLIQVDLAGEESKFGIAEDGLDEAAAVLSASDSVLFEGLMAIPPYFENPEDVRPFFRRLREMRDRLQAKNLFSRAKGELSMGMSHDFKVAIEEGATLVRIGTAIFGPREQSR